MKYSFLFILLTLGLLFPKSYAQISRPLKSKEERSVELKDSLSGNEFLDGSQGVATAKLMIELQDRIIDQGGCNLNLCFGLDGSRLISAKDYERQREFVQLIAATVAIDERVKMSAYQYGLRLQRISSFTGDIDSFLLRMESAKRKKTLSRSFLSPALFKCQRDFRDNGEDANKIVIIGDGRTNYGRKSLAIRIAARFLPPFNNGAICAVYVKRPAIRFLEKITQDPSKVISVEEYFLFDEILEETVSNVCDLV